MQTNYQILRLFAFMLVALAPAASFTQGFRTFGTNADARILTIYDGPGNDDAKVHIGHEESNPPTADYNLYVEDGVLTEAVKVANPQDWSDFVFAQGYHLRSLNDVEQFIKTNKHLPDVPSEKQIIEQGYYDQHEINKILLQKIEELTLYVIELNKSLDMVKRN